MANAAMIESDNFEALAKNRDLVLPEGREPAEPGNEQDRETDALPLVIQ
ncbi:MAG: hypothetical protein JO212_10400 [Acetobacteraceae bacterium]|nr:hypothetical protein [Acetobacteraceae bacterium]